MQCESGQINQIYCLLRQDYVGNIVIGGQEISRQRAVADGTPRAMIGERRLRDESADGFKSAHERVGAREWFD